MPYQSDHEPTHGGPDDVELLAYLHGELAGARKLEVANLAADSVEVRSRLEAMEQDLALGSDAMSSMLTPVFPRADEALEAIHKRLNRERTSEKKTPVVLAARVEMKSIPSRPWVRIAACLLATAGVSYWFLGRQSVGKVSAAEIMRRSAGAELVQIRAVATPVIHQRLVVSRRQAAAPPVEATWELWNQVGADRFREESGRVGQEMARTNDQAATDDSSVVTELRDVYAQNGVDGKRPLSPGAFASWRTANKGIESVKQARTQQGEEAFALTATPAGPVGTDGIVEAEFLVRSSDWHPVHQRLKVQGSDGIREYELTEDTYEVVTLTSVASNVFASPAAAAGTIQRAEAPPAVTPLSHALPIPEPTRQSFDPRSDLFAAGIEAEYVLHRQNVCTAVTVHLSPQGIVLVQGIAQSERRRQEILSELNTVKGASLLKIDIRAMNQPSEPSQTAARQPIPEVRTPDAVSAADQALIEATGLYLLTELDPLSANVAIPTESSQHLEEMVRDHLKEISARLVLIEHVKAFNVSETSHAGDANRTQKWPEAAVSVFRDVRSLDSLLNGVPAGNVQESSDSAKDAAPQLLLSSLLSRTADPVATVTGWFAPLSYATPAH